MENHSPHEACDQRIAELESQLAKRTAELETTLRRLDAARAEIARAASCQASPQ